MSQKQMIVEQAAKMFIHQGIKAVRMDDIARELSISKRTLYEIFHDKEELLYLGILHYTMESRKRRLESIAAIDNDLEVMIHNLREMINQAPTISRVRRNLKRFYPAVYERLEAESQKHSKDDIRGWIKKCVAKGYFTETADCDFVVRVFCDSVQGIMVFDREDMHNSLEMISLMSYSLVIFIRGLCTIEGIKIIDDCFDKYFGNIPSPDTLNVE
ncbi:MAG: TetR/AcrR family transcriptional regulator [Alistipes sp.]|nr:TetR/AcrR family transcriptional regulator [Alistipes sp.]